MSLLHQGTKQKHIACFLLLIVLCGCSEAEKKTSSPTVIAEPDPVAEFTAIVDGIRERRIEGIGFVMEYSGDTPTPYWRFEFRYSTPKFDVVKTNSLVTPYAATVTMTEAKFIQKFNYEGPAKSAILSDAARELAAKSGYGHADGWDVDTKQKRYTFQYEKNKWVVDDQFFPWTNLHEIDAHNESAFRVHPPRD